MFLSWLQIVILIAYAKLNLEQEESHLQKPLIKAHKVIENASSFSKCMEIRLSMK